MYNVTPGPISTEYFIILCVSVCVSLLSLLGNVSLKCTPLFIATQRFGKHIPAAKNSHNTRKIVGRFCLWVCLCIPLTLLGNKSVKTFPRQGRIVEGDVFYVVRVVLKDSRLLILHRIFCFRIMVFLIATVRLPTFTSTLKMKVKNTCETSHLPQHIIMT
jgi:hypothetical protein